MGFKVSFKDITMPKFNQAVGRIYQTQQFEDVRSAYKLKRLVEKIETQQKTFYSMYSDIQKNYLIDVPVEGEEGKTTKTIDPEKQEEFAKKIEELGATEVEIEWHPLSLKDFEGLKISAQDFALIEPILDEASLDELLEAPQS